MSWESFRLKVAPPPRSEAPSFGQEVKEELSRPPRSIWPEVLRERPARAPAEDVSANGIKSLETAGSHLSAIAPSKLSATAPSHLSWSDFCRSKVSAAAPSKVSTCAPSKASAIPPGGSVISKPPSMVDAMQRIEFHPSTQMVREYYLPFRQTLKTDYQLGIGKIPRARSSSALLAGGRQRGGGSSSLSSLSATSSVKIDPRNQSIANFCAQKMKKDNIVGMFSMPVTKAEQTPVTQAMHGYDTEYERECKEVNKEHHFKRNPVVDEARDAVRFKALMRP